MSLQKEDQVKILKEMVPQVQIETQGDFKYILIEVHYSSLGIIFEFVRGDSQSEYHKDIKNKFIQELAGVDLDEFKMKIDIRVKGGGRMEWINEKLRIFGFSYAYGQGDHEHVKEIILKNKPEISSIETSKEGY